MCVFVFEAVVWKDVLWLSLCGFNSLYSALHWSSASCPLQALADHRMTLTALLLLLSGVPVCFPSYYSVLAVFETHTHTRVHARLPCENVGILLSLLIYIWITFILEFVLGKMSIFLLHKNTRYPQRYLGRSLPPGGRLRYFSLRLPVLRQFGQIPSLDYLFLIVFLM